MREKLLALGFKLMDSEKHYMYIDEQGFNSYICESKAYIDGIQADCWKLKYVWHGDFTDPFLDIEKPFLTFGSIVKCIEDFKKFHKEYL